MTIQEVFHDSEFADVVFFLNERGFLLFSDLASFDFEELYFVPGLSEEIIAKVMTLYQKTLHQIQNPTVAEDSSLSSEDDMPNEYPAAADPCSDVVQSLSECIGKLYEASRAVSCSEDIQYIRMISLRYKRDPSCDYELFLELCIMVP